MIVKICGLQTSETLEAAIAADADMAGFVFFETSPRNIDLETAQSLGAQAAGRIAKVALTVDASDEALDAIVAALSPDFLQLHGGESPARVEAIKARFGLPIIKAIGVASAEDLLRAEGYASADILLFDAKPSPDATLPGGNGVAFDWSLLAGASPGKPWLLSGGLDPENVAQALMISKAPGVDVSSGVEKSRGVKAPGLIAAFVAAARARTSL
ncbi:phosphoribosylanthranilate isomerase [Methylocystis heyeri]|uniref:N-(5'-phosphoribosyl)anthranilate isomerase n=1 Tax=Methylocystis heyeri TaxID=391905 RepID=A0A6B8KLG5_9HYPH|nr:phosphoribosylanthranilate isomerase [Methylocystis heyeri]QGM47690.1 phosphoribosylanthranilate isomerase [Methylocystis heyeri]